MRITGLKEDKVQTFYKELEKAKRTTVFLIKVSNVNALFEFEDGQRVVMAIGRNLVLDLQSKLVYRFSTQKEMMHLNGRLDLGFKVLSFKEVEVSLTVLGEKL